MIDTRIKLKKGQDKMEFRSPDVAPRSKLQKGVSASMSEPVSKIGMTPPHVGTFIREEILDELNLSISKAADVLNVRRATLSDLINEKASLTPEMALRIEKAFGVNMDTLLKMQAWYDTVTMRQHADEIDVKRYQPAE